MNRCIYEGLYLSNTKRKTYTTPQSIQVLFRHTKSFVLNPGLRHRCRCHLLSSGLPANACDMIHLFLLDRVLISFINESIFVFSSVLLSISLHLAPSSYYIFFFLLKWILSNISFVLHVIKHKLSVLFAQ